MIPQELVQTWQERNLSWITKVFHSVGKININPTQNQNGVVTGHAYALLQASPRAGALIPHASTCGQFGGVTKIGAPCKKSGSGLSGRCYAHPGAPVEFSNPIDVLLNDRVEFLVGERQFKAVDIQDFVSFVQLVDECLKA